MLADARYALFIKIHEICDIFLALPTNSTPGYALHIPHNFVSTVERFMNAILDERYGDHQISL